MHQSVLFNSNYSCITSLFPCDNSIIRSTYLFIAARKFDVFQHNPSPQVFMKFVFSETPAKYEESCISNEPISHDFPPLSNVSSHKLFKNIMQNHIVTI